tara:strand:- start:1799 stop:2053 length:255 start_codon:yes stop_codon:yes gene_type:complete
MAGDIFDDLFKDKEREKRLKSMLLMASDIFEDKEREKRLESMLAYRDRELALAKAQVEEQAKTIEHLQDKVRKLVERIDQLPRV